MRQSNYCSIPSGQDRMIYWPECEYTLFRCSTLIFMQSNMVIYIYGCIPSVRSSLFVVPYILWLSYKISNLWTRKHFTITIIFFFTLKSSGTFPAKNPLSETKSNYEALNHTCNKMGLFVSNHTRKNTLCGGTIEKSWVWHISSRLVLIFICDFMKNNEK